MECFHISLIVFFFLHYTLKYFETRCVHKVCYERCHVTHDKEQWNVFFTIL